MDVHQLALLSRQPSAALKERPNFWGMPKRGLALILANAMFWQPLLVQAEGIVVSGTNTSLKQAGNGVPVVNIAAPNASGLSHNQYQQYNVDSRGVILNNATSQTQSTQLGGIIIGNSNLNGRAANVILNEVIGANASQLNGYTEVAGQSARVIVANPYGISCNGCGFINTPRVTLTTGKPVLDGNGQLNRFNVQGGSVSIDGDGLNAGNVDHFDIVTRSAKINAELHANKLNIIAGRNDVDANTLNAKALAEDGSAKPELAIDSSALGGMYAGAVRLVGTEAGVGVKLAGNVAASGGDIQIEANGRLTVAQISASGAIAAKAVSADINGPVYAGSSAMISATGDLAVRQNIAARDVVNLSAGGQLTNAAIIEAGVNSDNSRNAAGDVMLSANSLINTGSVTASRNLQATVTQTLTNQGAIFSGQASADITAGTLDNRKSGKLLSQVGTVIVKADQLFNEKGAITSAGKLTVKVGTLNNSNGRISSDADLALAANGKILNQMGEITSAGSTLLTAMSLGNMDGQIMADRFLSLVVTDFIDNQAGTLGAGLGVDIKASGVDNRAGTLVTDGNAKVALTGAFNNRSGGSLQTKGRADISSLSLDNQGGFIRAHTGMQLLVDSIDNSQIGLTGSGIGLIYSNAGLELVGTQLDNRSGQLSSKGPLQITTGTVLNDQGRIASQAGLVAAIDTLTQKGGELVAQGDLTLSGKTLDNQAGGLVGSTKAVKLTVDNVDNRDGEISSDTSLEVIGQSLDNSNGGKILAGTNLGLSITKVINSNKGLLFGDTLTVTGASLDNTGGSVAAQKNLNLDLSGVLDNRAGLLSSEGTLTVKAGELLNTLGSLSSASKLQVTTDGELNNRRGSITTDAGLVLVTGSLDNSNKGSLAGKGATRVETGLFDNSQGGYLTSSDTLQLTAAKVINQSAGRIASALALTANVTGLDQQGGELFSNTALSLDLNGGQLNNQGGLIMAPGTLLLKNLKGVDNQNGEISSEQSFDLSAESLDNSGGKLLSNQTLMLVVDKALRNLKGTISSAALSISSDSLDNTEGLISSRSALDLAVDTALTNIEGTVISDGDLELNASTANNTKGQIASKQNLNANVDRFEQLAGELVAQGSLTLTGKELVNGGNGFVGATQGLNLIVTDVDNRGGEISGQGAISFTGDHLNNSDGGRVLAQQALTVDMAKVINRAGVLQSSKAGLTLTGVSLDNTGGYVSAVQGVGINLFGALENSRGLISSEDQLTIEADSLVNAAGSVSSAGKQTLKVVGAINNDSGELVTDDALDLRSASLTNRQSGTISGKTLLTLNTGNFDNSYKGRVSSGDQLHLTAAKLVNGSEGSIGSSKALVASVTSLDQQGGRLFSNTSLSLDLNNGELNNRDGLINAPGTMLLKNLGIVLNQGGEISSAEAFTLSAQALDNSGGKLLSNQNLTLRVAQALNNVKGTIAGAGVEIEADTLNSSGGTLISRNNLALTLTGQVSNRDNGLINSGGALVLTAASLDAGNGGEVSASGDMTLTLGALSLDAGRLIGDAAVSIDLNTGDLSNQGGLITAKGPLTIKRLRDLYNQSGEISSDQSFMLSSRTLNNGGGKIISSNLLTLNATALDNQKGLISGWEGVTVTGGTLDNSNTGTVSSRNGGVDVILSGGLLNSNAGALVSQKALSIEASSLDNSNGILSSGAGQLLAVTGLLNNSQSGLIDSGESLVIKADTLNNSAGNVTAQKDITVEARALDNSNGNLSSKGTMTLDLLGQLVNTQGKLASGSTMLLRRSTQISNRGGQLVSQGLMTLNTGSLDNSSRGTIAASSSLVLNATGKVFNNADGLIYSQNADLQLTAAAIDNARGALQSQSTLNVDVSGDIDNQSGRIIAQAGALDVVASNLDSRGGVLSSLEGAFTANVTGVLRNGYDLTNNRQGGVIQAHSMNLSALGGFDNNGGRISARTGDALITTGNFDNRSGGLYGKGLMRVIARGFDNSAGGQIAASQIDLRLSGTLNNQTGIVESDSTLAVAATAVDNQNGRLRALGSSGKTDFQIGSLFNNTNGTLDVANSNLTLNVPTFLNSGGSLLHTGSGKFDISTRNVINAGGSVLTRGGLTLTSDSWTNSSVIQAGNLTVNVGTFHQTSSGQLLASTSFTGSGGNWTNDGLIASDGSIDIRVDGTYSGNGRTSSAGLLALKAGRINLSSATAVTAGTSGIVTSVGSISNFGRLSSIGDLVVSAGSLDNQGTLGSASNLRINTGSLSNQNGLIFSGGNMALRVNEFTNRFADVYSLGDLSVARDDNNGWSSVINNVSATMESGRDMTLAANQINNRKDVFEAVGGLVSGAIGVQCNSCTVLRNRAESSHLVWIENYSSTVIQDSASSNMIAGSNFTANGGDFTNNASLITAGKDLSLNLSNFSNKGATTGDYTLRRSLSAPKDLKSWRAIMTYNAANDPAYGSLDSSNFFRPAMHFWTASGEESIVGFGTSGGGGERTPQVRYATIWIDDLTSGYQPPKPTYNRGIRVDAPAAIRNANFSENVIISNSSSSAANAVVQAGGAVRINATQDLTNGVVREGITLGSGASRVGVTALSGRAAPTVVLLNAQLPPNLAQQQVNPLSLPGFSLPTGQNGLFRLSSQAINPTSTGDTPSPSWTLGTAAVSLQERDREVTPAPARLTALGTTGQLTGSTRQLGATERLSSVLDTQASAYDTSAPNSSNNGGLLIPAHSSGVTSSVAAVGRVQGLPSSIGKSKPQKYLIETNPVLTELKQFMSSDYLLSKLGYDPDTSAKRLGDGLYEQRLVQHAVVARTGQAFLSGQTSNEDQFRYLMNNAIASKDQLNLSVGVSLSSQQVAALTHDIVWLEEHEVNGEKVLVPVVYLAQADNRLGPTGALIAGKDVSLIAGENLDNVGTLRALNNLSAVAGKSIVNDGLIEAGNRLELLAGNDITNKSGGIIAGRDVSATAISGDITNERTLTSMDNSTGGKVHKDFADSAARIEATNDLSLKAGRDINNVGSVLQSGRDMTLDSERDTNITSTQVTQSKFINRNNNSSAITQVGSTVTVGRDLTIQGGRDINAIASQIDVKRDIAMAATGNVIISSAADEEHSYSKSKKVTRQEDHVSQVTTDITAGGSVVVSAGQNLAIVSSRITAGNEAYLVAGGKLDILAAQDSDYSLYDMKKKGSWGKKKTRRDEITKVTNIGSSITTGGNLLLASGGDQHYQVAKLNSGGDLTINSGGAITFEGVKDLHDESHVKSNSNSMWFSSKGKGKTDETLRQSELNAKGAIIIQAVDGLQIDIKQVNQQSVSQSIDAMVKADPQLAWLKEAEKRGDVDWRQVKEIHESFKYANSGLGPAAQVIIAILMAAVMGPAGFGLLGTSGALATSVATTAATSVINNKGNLGAAFKDMTSSESMKGYALSAAMGSLMPTIDPTQLGLNLASLSVVASRVATESLLKTAIMGGSFKDNLGSAALGAAVSIGGAKIAQKIGDFTVFEDGKLTKVAMHAALGGLMAEAMGGDFRSGALAAGANEMVVEYLARQLLPANGDPSSDAYQAGVSKLLTASQLIGALTAAATGGDASAAAAVAANGTQYNQLGHFQLKEAAQKLRTCTPSECEAIVAEYRQISIEQAIDALTNCMFDVSLCVAPSRDEANTAANLSSIHEALGDGSNYAKDALQVLINENLGFQGIMAMATTGATSDAIASAVQAQFNLTPAETSALSQIISEGLGAAAGGPVGFRQVLKAASARGKNNAQAPGDAVGPKGAGDTLATLSQGQKRAVGKIDNILNNFKDSDITGTLKDMAGNPVPKPGGGYWDHLKEMNDTLRGLRNHADTLKGVNEPSAQAARQRAVDTINRIESALNGAGI